MNRVLLCVFFCFCACLAFGQEVTLFDRIQDAIQSRNLQSYLDLVSKDPETQSVEKEFFQSFLDFGYQKGIVKVAAQEKNRLVLHILAQREDEAAFQAWRIETTTENDREVIRERKAVSNVSGLYRLKLAAGGIPIENVQFPHLDALFRFKKGKLFLLRAGTEVTGVIFLGDGTFEFSPRNDIERQQVTLFCKKPQLVTKLNMVYLRSSGQYFRSIFKDLLTKPEVPDEGNRESAEEIAAELNPSVGSISVPLSDEVWYSKLQRQELFCQMKTSHGNLVYQYSPSEPNDVLLAHKDKERIISLYNSAGKRTAPPPEEDFQIELYKINIQYNPLSQYISAVVNMQITSLYAASDIVFKLNSGLRVTQIRSGQGPLLYFHEKKSNNLHVVMNEVLKENEHATLDFYYQGRLEPELAKSEAQALREEKKEFHIPESFLYSNQSVWYPQLPDKPYCKAEFTITVPSDYTAVANGAFQNKDVHEKMTSYLYKMNSPAKYFSFLAGKLSGHVSQKSIVPIDVYYYSIDGKTAAEFAKNADDILRFYSNYFGKYAYDNLNVILRPMQMPGGHSPANVVIVNRVFTFWQQDFRRDPLYIPEFPTFVLAHELAHQWWGQAVGWRTYQDQWLSEGFAQYAAWEYIASRYGDKGRQELADEFWEWITKKNYAGPITLGVRLGHMTNDAKAFSAVVYNKGAYVLNMLRNWMGSEAFTAALQEFYSAYRFKLATIDDFRNVAQRHSQSDLNPFFEQWLYRWQIPSVTWQQNQDGNALLLHFEQPDGHFFYLKVPIEVKSKEGKTIEVVAVLDQAKKEVDFQLPFAPATVTIDPKRENLMKVNEEGGKNH